MVCHLTSFEIHLKCWEEAQPTQRDRLLCKRDTNSLAPSVCLLMVVLTRPRCPMVPLYDCCIPFWYAHILNPAISAFPQIKDEISNRKSNLGCFIGPCSSHVILLSNLRRATSSNILLRAPSAVAVTLLVHVV